MDDDFIQNTLNNGKMLGEISAMRAGDNAEINHQYGYV